MHLCKKSSTFANQIKLWKMERQLYFNCISEKLTALACRIEVEGKLNILDLHIHAEDFYRDFLSHLFDWRLINMNSENQNVEAIDLVDETNKLIVQVSATNTKEKINHSLSKIDITKYPDYTFKFISIARSADALRDKTYKTPNRISFDPKNDICDVVSLLKIIQHLRIDKLEEIYNFINKELGSRVDLSTIDSDLTNVIQILSQTDLSTNNVIRLNNEFEIDNKIEYNHLSTESRDVIRDYCLYQNIVGKIYSTFDKEGINKSLFVLNRIRGIYIEQKGNLEGDKLFGKIRQCVKSEIYNSPNRGNLTKEAIEMCADIIIVDAFIRCKIFENPQGYQDVTA